jgi:hypothetical protein
MAGAGKWALGVFKAQQFEKKLAANNASAKKK